MTPDRPQRSKLERRVVEAAEAALDKQRYVTALDVLAGLGWLMPSSTDRWRQGRVDYLEREITASLNKISTAMKVFHRWAVERDLRPSETAYQSRTRDHHALRFSKSGDPTIEQAYRTHWVSPALSAAKQQRLADAQARPPDLVVIDALNDWECTECGGTDRFLIMEGDGPLCLECADLDHLVYLPRSDAALTRRAKKASSLSAVVVRFSRARKRYERQGLLVEPDALASAEEQCLADDELRRARRERESERRAREDVVLRDSFASEIRRLFPGCPAARADAISRRAVERSSGRVGRSAAGRALDADAVTLAVVADIRHRDTRYDELLMRGVARADARDRVRSDLRRVHDSWRAPPPPRR